MKVIHKEFHPWKKETAIRKKNKSTQKGAFFCVQKKKKQLKKKDLQSRKKEGYSARKKYGWSGKDDTGLVRCYTKKNVPKFGTKDTGSHKSRDNRFEWNMQNNVSKEKMRNFESNTMFSASKENGVVQKSTSTLSKTKKGLSVASLSSPAGYIGTKAMEIANKVKDEIVNTLQRNIRRGMEDRKESQNSDGTLVAFLIVLFLLIPIPTLIYINMIAENMNGGNTIVSVALQELEASDSNIGGRKYKEWYGINGDWCAMFVSYCANECGLIEKGIMPKQAAVRYMALWYQEEGRWIDNESGYEPKPGDIIFFQNGMSHVGIVISYDVETKIIYTIEGNTGTSNTNPYHEGSSVKEKRYPVTYQKISGYGIPNYEFKEEMN